MRISIVDTGGANLSSVVNAFARLGVEAVLTGEWKEIEQIPVGTMLLGSDGKLVELKSVERIIEKAPVYNFHVQPHRNYIANGITVHNRSRYMVDQAQGQY